MLSTTYGTLAAALRADANLDPRPRKNQSEMPIGHFSLDFPRTFQPNDCWEFNEAGLNFEATALWGLDAGWLQPSGGVQPPVGVIGGECVHIG
jgi:hypothetical protein